MLFRLRLAISEFEVSLSRFRDPNFWLGSFSRFWHPDLCRRSQAELDRVGDRSGKGEETRFISESGFRLRQTRLCKEIFRTGT